MPPDFPGLTSWPVLQRVVTRRWKEAHDWHTARKRAGIDAGLHRDLRIDRVVADVEDEIGRKARPFSLEFVVLPVRDDQIRPIRPTRWLVPERLYDSARWPEHLRALVITVA